MRVRTLAVVVACGLLLAGCEKKSENRETEDRAARAAEIVENPEAAAAAALKDGPAALGTARTGGGELSCDAAVPEALRGRYMKGTAMQSSSLLERTLMCSAKKDGSIAWHFTYDCRRTTTLAQFEQKYAEEKETVTDTRRIEGLGRAAFGTDTGVHFYDDDADCYVTAATYVEGETILELAKELSQVLTPGMLPPLPKGALALDCQKLVPEPLRARFVPGTRLEMDSAGANQMSCNFKKKDGTQPGSVSYGCVTKVDARFIEQMKAGFARQKMKAVDVPVGVAGIYNEIYGSHSVTFADAETGCMVSLNTQSDKQKTLEFARELEKILTAESAR